MEGHQYGSPNRTPWIFFCVSLFFPQSRGYINREGADLPPRSLGTYVYLSRGLCYSHFIERIFNHIDCHFTLQDCELRSDSLDNVLSLTYLTLHCIKSIVPKFPSNIIRLELKFFSHASHSKFCYQHNHVTTPNIPTAN